MKSAWTAQATADLDNLVRPIARDTVDAAFRIEDRVIAAVARLQKHPQSGRAGSWRGTGELVVARTPYIAVYRVREDNVEILRIIHGAQNWPPS